MTSSQGYEPGVLDKSAMKEEVTIDLLELLHELGYLEGALWQARKNPRRVVKVVSRTESRVTYGTTGNLKTTSIRKFLKWFELKTETRLATVGGVIAS